MIHIFIGTKAQFIKMAPIMRELQRRGLQYNYIDTGQHADLTAELAREFGLREPDVRLRKRPGGITTTGQALIWSIEILFHLLFGKSEIKKTVFGDRRGGICLIHGDTLTTLYSLLYAKRCGIPVAHVEAGLRSYHLFDPFPEEMIRLAAMRYSDLLFAPSNWAMDNLVRMGYGARSIHAGGNTVVDTIRFARARYSGQDQPVEPFVVVTIHRVETLFSYERMKTVVAFIEEIARWHRVFFVLHEPTRRQLERLRLLGRLQSCSRIDMMPLQPYLKFLDLLAGADFVVTDGGSIQEECYSLNIPCLIMRAKTERMEGLGENAMLCGFSRPCFEEFLCKTSRLKRKVAQEDGVSPSRLIVDHLQKYLERQGGDSQ